jgi:membrane-associated phospholipid phosphatase
VARLRFQWLAILAIPLVAWPAAGQEAEAPEQPAAAQPQPTTEQPQTDSSSSSTAAVVLHALENEAKRYLSDGGGYITAPIHWDETDWKKFAGFTFVLGGLLMADHRIYIASQNHRSDFTNNVSDATTPFGAEYAWGVAGGLLVGGLIFKSENTLDMGREAIEAGVFSGLLVNLVFKPVFGRERPLTSNGHTDFDPFSGNNSFPSGHATLAFSVASVVAMRADGWLIPGLAYALATVVAFDRVNDQAHFPSDVFAGAVLGTVTGRFLVARHRRQAAGEQPKVSIDVTPTRRGLVAHVLF